MLETRVERLEERFAALDQKINEILLTGAKKDDVQQLRIEMAKLEGRLSGIEGRLLSVPTTWQIVTILGTLLLGLSGIIFTASKFFHP